ncbi:alpha/beta fold hydrolase [Hyalangium rubrum]|uniref:Alpha/beta hydrolase n=1 Tax=Hyalangium rubrum TaxID=3103134 RepID=A0ABU5H6D4_9BACT|nr:alpha/beta hydrolase [Hyalangium sp. s54d21]MDY7228900.1 alpha/beta hydrolase [Hyalangium sp. s54d21]
MERFIEVNGIRLHYLDHPGGAPLLVLMHGLSANAHCFDGLVEAGLSPRFRVVSVDLRGRGLSDKPPSGYSMAEHARDILGLLDALGTGPVVLGGHSFGGLLSFYIAAHWPERVSRLLILDAAGAMHPRVRELIQPSLDRLGKVLPSVDAYLAAMKQAPYLEGMWNAGLEAYYRADVKENPDGTAQARSSPQALAEAVENALGEPWPELLPRIRQPTLLLHAPNGFGVAGTPPVVPREQALETVRTLPNGRYVEVPGNHYTMLFGGNASAVVQAITEQLMAPNP